ncbi:MAG TPA: flagellar biosynthesis protein FlhA [Solirubrobacteraceae bacterium]|nr:flagellar biosynthesis protein FlhA [Solirubrobacteraceae bacterium]
MNLDSPFVKRLTRHTDLLAAGGVVLIIAMLVVPLPPFLLDIAITLNISAALAIVVTTMYVQKALDFSAFPTLLLLTTLFRLAINISVTRLILLEGDAGHVIKAFGDFVVGGNVVVGLIIFLVLIVIQFVVVTNGAGRVAEVGARFTLDAMPGKQLAIDADLRAGILDKEGAQQRRRTLEREAQLYGAMDGAMKFVKGDAIASIIIVFVNLLGGLAIGVVMRGMELEQALRTYSLLTIGDGLVAQIPALLLSTSAGLVVTRVASEQQGGTLGRDLAAQIFGDWRALAVASGFAGLLAIVPGLPLVPFAVLAVALGGGAYLVRRRRRVVPVVEREGPVALELGRALMELEVPLDRVRDDLLEKLGLRLPLERAVLRPRLDPFAYAIRIGGVVVDRGRCPAGRRFVAGDADKLRAIDPSVELDSDGGWVASGDGKNAADVLAARLSDAILARPELLIGIEETQEKLDRTARDAPALVRTVVPDRITLPQLAALLRALVAEGVRVDPLREILEALAIDPLPDNPSSLVARVRERLARQLTHELAADGELRVYALDPMLEDGVRDGLGKDGEATIDPELARDLVEAVRKAIKAETRPVLVTQPDVRAPLRRLLAPELPKLAVLSYREVDPSVRVRRLGTVSP